ncbi:hypothetical protein [Aequorivita marisscotiae]|uniref:C1q domain-containing protein n=1 Tax=Aequorivita marisscotiae TaxID=3040348 RepID=A0ABY8KYW6_9FLAO|nr:hypothetical protein [Aequorivita sp. Ant34-E75]WGF92907.1 hypothetical protein QCQ61_01640 [Aequorivita sp. Ant34-E75]
MTKTIILLVALIASIESFSQVGIGNIDPAESSLLDINDSNNDKGILIPRVDIADLNTQAPITTTTIEESLLVYNTNITTGKGFYYWSGTNWIRIQASGDDKSIYAADDNLIGARTVGLNGYSLNFNSGNNVALQIDNNRRLTFGGYGGTTFAGNPLNLLGVNSTGQVISLNTNTAFTLANSDWFEESTTSPPNSINDNIYTNGEVGINIISPNAPLHIFEETGTAPSNSDGTVILEHGDDGGISSIVFRSHVNSTSDYGYISYSDNGSGNGSGVESSLLEIGVQNDTPTGYPQGIDNINLAATGSIGVANVVPDGSSSIDLGANDRGLLVNRVTLTAANNASPISNPANGLLVFNTATNLSPTGYENDVRPGFYYWSTAQSRWIPQTPESRSARYTNRNTTFNLNQASAQSLPIFGYEEWNDDSTLYQATIGNNGNQIIVREDGRYEVTANISITSPNLDNNRTNIDAEFVVNPNTASALYPGATASTGYIRNNGQHNNSSLHLFEVIELETNDILVIEVMKEAGGSTVTMRVEGGCNFTIKKVK